MQTAVNKIVRINERNIAIELELHVMRIINNDELQLLFANDTENITAQLVAKIKEEYHQLFNEDFKVADASIAIEIWGHVYTDKFAEAIKSFSSVQFVDAFAEKIVERCEVIDIGESGHDENRFFWDALSPFKSAIEKLLPK